MTILIVGDSHVRCMAHALNSWPKPHDFEIIKVAREGEKPNAGEASLKAVCKRVKRLREGDLLFTAMLGRMHNVFGLLAPEVPFDFFEYPGDQNVSPHYQLIPHGTLKGIFRHYMAKPGPFDAILSASRVKPAIISPPPVIGGYRFIMESLTKYRGALVAERGIGKIRMRTKLWRMEVDCLREFAQDKELGFLPVPAEAKTWGDVLRGELYGNDATHANKHYGRMVLRQITDLVQGV